MTRTKLAFVVFVVAGCLGVGFSALSGQRPVSQDYEFVRTTLLTGELRKREVRVARWMAPVTVSLMNGGGRYRDYVKSIVDDLNRSVDGLTISMADSKNGSVKINFVSLRFLQNVLKKEGVRSLPRPPKGYFRTRWEPDWVVAEAVILVDAALDEVESRRTLLQELVQTLGPINDSPLHPESAMYETDATPSTATALAPIDRKLLRFLYRYLKPGDDEVAVRAAFDKYWDSIPSN